MPFTATAITINMMSQINSLGFLVANGESITQDRKRISRSDLVALIYKVCGLLNQVKSFDQSKGVCYRMGNEK